MSDVMKPYMARDLKNLFANDFTVAAKYKGKIYQVIPGDDSNSEADELGGSIPIDQNEYHFQASDNPGIENGQELKVLGKNYIIVTFVESADGAEIIVRVRAA